MKRAAFAAVAVIIASGCMGSSSSSPSQMATTPESHSRAQTVRVPEVKNESIYAVIPTLHRAGLRITISKPWGLSSFDGPFAWGLTPSTGTRVPDGSVVSFGIGALPGSPWSRLGHHVVPDVSGETLGQATKQIWAAKLPWQVHATALPPTSATDLFSAYCVTSQMPDAGTVIAVGRASSHRIREVGLQAKPC